MTGEQSRHVITITELNNYIKNLFENVSLAPESMQMQNAWGVCRTAENAPALSAAELTPVYLRLSQAERERLEKMKDNK